MMLNDEPVVDRNKAAALLFYLHWMDLSDHLKENWHDYVVYYLISTPLDKFDQVDHLALFIHWCHTRDIPI